MQQIEETVRECIRVEDPYDANEVEYDYQMCAVGLVAHETSCHKREE